MPYSLGRFCYINIDKTIYSKQDISRDARNTDFDEVKPHSYRQLVGTWKCGTKMHVSEACISCFCVRSQPLRKLVCFKEEAEEEQITLPCILFCENVNKRQENMSTSQVSWLASSSARLVRTFFVFFYQAKGAVTMRKEAYPCKKKIERS